MEAIDRAILLLFDYKKSNRGPDEKIILVDTIDLLEKILEIKKFSIVKRFHALKCIECFVDFQGRYKTTLYCPKCYEARKKRLQKEKKDKLRERKQGGANGCTR